MPYIFIVKVKKMKKLYCQGVAVHFLVILLIVSEKQAFKNFLVVIDFLTL